MRLAAILSLIAVAATGAAVQAAPLSLTVNPDCSYAVSINGQAALSSGPTSFRADGSDFSTADGSLQLLSVSPPTEGEDTLGAFTATTCAWTLGSAEQESPLDSPASASASGLTGSPESQPPSSAGSIVQTEFKLYASLGSIVFSQLFPSEGLSSTNTSDRNTLCTAFPSFQRNDAFGFLSYNGDFVKYTEYNTGLWSNSSGEDTQIASGLSSGPTVFMLASSPSTVLVTSAFSSFMVSSQVMSDDVLSLGLLGSILSIPPTNYSASTILTVGIQGVGAAMAQWGSILRTQYDKPARGWEADDSTQWLGYNTDNGAYYYYQTEPGKTYQQTLIDVWLDAQSRSIPYSTVLLDSWWYYKGEIGGVKNWSARPDIFPDGIESLRGTTGFTSIIAHNRYWSADNVYALHNGGGYEFIVDPIQHSAMPQSQPFWDDLFSEAKARWGLSVYEQDWLYNEFEGVSAATSDVSVAERWLTQMAHGASKAGITIQYCMPWPRHLLQSVSFPAVTQARASDDYQPGMNNQWKIGLSSLLYSALGLAPFKDNFWTTQYQPGNPYGYNEPHPALQSAVASFSLGPVTIGDDLGRSNRELIMKSCRADGRLLQPDHPPFALDTQIVQAALGRKDASGALGPQGQLWITSTSLLQDAPAGEGLAWFALLTANLTAPYSFTLQELSAQAGMQQSDSLSFVVWSWTNASSFLDPLPTVVTTLTSADPLLVSECGMVDFSVYYLSPQWNAGWSLLGEWSKWTAVSRMRVRGVSLEASQVTVDLMGAPNEVVELAWSDAQSQVHSTKCMMDDEGGATIVVQTPAAASPLQYTCSTDAQ